MTKYDGDTKLAAVHAYLVGILRHKSNGAFSTKDDLKELVVPMGIGSILGAFIGGVLVVYVQSGFVKLVLGCILIVSAAKMFLKHKKKNLYEKPI